MSDTSSFADAASSAARCDRNKASSYANLTCARISRRRLSPFTTFDPTESKTTLVTKGGTATYTVLFRVRTLTTVAATSVTLASNGSESFSSSRPVPTDTMRSRRTSFLATGGYPSMRPGTSSEYTSTSYLPNLSNGM